MPHAIPPAPSTGRHPTSPGFRRPGRARTTRSARRPGPRRRPGAGAALALAMAGWVACAEPEPARTPGAGEAAAPWGSAAGAVPADDSAASASLRHAMVRRQIAGRGVADPAVLEAMRTVPRHRFVPGAPMAAAYSDRPLRIGHGQTISQPYIVAFMAEAAAIEPGDRVLEIGTGSGYGAAVLAELAGEVYTIEIVPELAERARRNLAGAGYGDVRVRTGNGWLGWPEHAPYDAIVVTAAPEEVPPALVEQLAVEGVMVIPVGAGLAQSLKVLRKTPDGLREEASLPVRFVPMVERPDTAG